MKSELFSMDFNSKENNNKIILNYTNVKLNN